MHFANIQIGNFIWGRVYGLGKIGRGKVYDSLQEYSPLLRPLVKKTVLLQMYIVCNAYCQITLPKRKWIKTTYTHPFQGGRCN